jgi:anti-sigma factor RsiW
MRCDRSHDYLGALADGEMSVEERNATIAHLNSCAECASQYQRLQTLRRRLLVARVPMPRSLVHRVRARIALETVELERNARPALPSARPPQPTGRAFTRAQPWLRQAAMILVACGISIAGSLWWSRTANERDMITRDVVAAHVRSLLQGNSVQVASLDTHTVKPWFAGRLEFTPVVKDLTAEGFRLAGGRLDYVGGRRVAVLIYMRQLHQITVFIWPGAQEESPKTAAPNGFNLVSWSRSGMSFWAISDLGQAELEELPPLL